jgi:hypothetical protein
MLGVLANCSHFYVVPSAVSVAATASFVLVDILNFQFTIILDRKKKYNIICAITDVAVGIRSGLIFEF